MHSQSGECVCVCGVDISAVPAPQNVAEIAARAKVSLGQAKSKQRAEQQAERFG